MKGKMVMKKIKENREDGEELSLGIRKKEKCGDPCSGKLSGVYISEGGIGGSEYYYRICAGSADHFRGDGESSVQFDFFFGECAGI